MTMEKLVLTEPVCDMWVIYWWKGYVKLQLADHNTNSCLKIETPASWAGLNPALINWASGVL
jgi:hypothetical protein